MEYPLVKIYWRDIQAGDSGWQKVKEIVEWGHKAYNAAFVTVGYLIEDNKHFVIVAATIDGYDQEYNDYSMIMKSVIVKTEKL